MKCPGCQDAKIAYTQKKPAKTPGKNVFFKRTDFSAKCKKCGWEGEI